MKKIVGKLVAVNLGKETDGLAKSPTNYLHAELDGFVGDRHRSIQRQCWQGDKQAKGSIRRNERQWSATSIEELAEITEKMDLSQPLTADKVSVNLCFEGIPKLSLLPKGSILKFSSGAELMVEEYNPPCVEMGEKLAEIFSTNSGKDLVATDFTKAAAFSRGLVGVVEVAGKLSVGDQVSVSVYQPPLWIAKMQSES
ncbi:hypothetical protein RI845_01580 [Thalassotalea nanhaiensis]|uniref:MOSC domain-containing protein n=1 Tax=Thalassotalea nanhaiensis TaxID=3065648 RepID=A0ABY9TK95_9GAMM|nr:hypothetical protein RI845_01580 [Colwelliaceae bacterium SQ345]